MHVVKPSPSLIALKPRQVVLLSNPTMKMEASAPSLTPHQNSLLLLSIARFLQRNSFSKTLKKFLSEAQIQKDVLAGSSLDLEEMCCKYLAKSDGQDCIASTVEVAPKKKKKRGNESSMDIIGGQSEVDDKSVNSKKFEEQVFKDAAKESATDKTKDKKKKKSKSTSDSLIESVGQHGSEDTQHAAVTLNASDISVEDKTSKSKKKKKKNDSEDVEKEKSTEENKISKVDSTITDDKGSKKRKRVDSEVHNSQPVDKNATEDSKRRKTAGSEEQLNSLVGADKNVGKENKGESGETDVDVLPKKPAKQFHEQENGNIEKNGKHSEQKSSKKQQNGSVQPKKPFQRVNVDEVEFVDSRLEDNSYWAKDGAETGYGAKAQEVLGQVRGRGFRHEKTKKKRGSYRGGQIDLQSHSIKFNYSDEE
ncbi:hypothetical protein ES332_A05G459100v1 [Gossypium tomentosum]|uniref:Srp40 C-terminal domain-containing protein n=1 Tax=Gossypium tomentosum TaxID=34277 RepID=A0A5D2QWG7_GOSTO|nr:hypothetical protein ES332_A05G459100v1 [Gossypium tomentosum]